MSNPFDDFLAVEAFTSKLPLVERLEAALAQAHHSEAALAQLSGVSIQRIHGMRTGHLSDVSIEEIQRVLAVLGGS